MRIISYCSGCHKLPQIVRIVSNVTKKDTVFDLSDLVDKSMTHDVFETSKGFEKKNDLEDIVFRLILTHNEIEYFIERKKLS